MTKIKFGTDGWRAIIAKEYTCDNVARVSIAVADWLNENNDNPSVVIGHDCRFAGELFAETAAKVLASKGILVKIAKGFVSTPIRCGERKIIFGCCDYCLTQSTNL